MHFYKKKNIIHAYNISIHFTVETLIDNIQDMHSLDLGQEFSLTCRASGYPVPTVSWVKEGSDFQSEVSFVYVEPSIYIQQLIIPGGN